MVRMKPRSNAQRKVRATLYFLNSVAVKKKVAGMALNVTKVTIIIQICSSIDRGPKAVKIHSRYAPPKNVRIMSNNIMPQKAINGTTMAVISTMLQNFSLFEAGSIAKWIPLLGVLQYL